MGQALMQCVRRYDSSEYISACSDNKETVEIETRTLHNSTDFQYQLI